MMTTTATKFPKTEAAMCDLLAVFAKESSLELASADEMLAELESKLTGSKMTAEQDQHARFLLAFASAWDAVVA